MKNYSIFFSYDGTNFWGSQKQKDRRTVQGEIEKALSKSTGAEILTTLAGRTDRGVHAIKQCANFFSKTLIPTPSLKNMLKNFLPGDIFVKDLIEVPINFNARRDALSRSYVYRMKLEKNISVFERNYFCPLDHALDLDAFKKIISPVVGLHDFSSFTKGAELKKNKKIEIIDYSATLKGDFYEISLEARSFLRGMVRIVIGSALAEYFGARKKGYFYRKLQNADPSAEKILAPPEGLYLRDIKY